MTTQPVIFVVDDNSLTSTLVAEDLGRAYRRIVFTNGREAARQVAAFAPELIIVTFTRPGLQSFRLARPLLDAAADRGVPVVVMAFDCNSGQRSELLHRGVRDVWPLPMLADELQTRVAIFLEHERRERELCVLVSFDAPRAPGQP